MKPIALGFVGDNQCKDILSYSRLAERNKYDSVWVSEDLGFRDAVTPLASLAMSTNRIGLATGIMPLYYRSPALAAMTLATLNELSKGRMILGIGNGVRSYVEKQGIEFRSPLKAMEEYIFILRQLLSGKSLTFEGEVYRLNDVHLSFETRSSRIPVYIASRRKRMFQLAGKIADGAIMNDGFCAESYIKWAMENMKIGAESAGRDKRDVKLVSLVWVSVSDNFDRAKEHLKPWFISLLVEGAFDPHMERLGISTNETNEVKQAWMRGRKKEAFEGISETMLDATAIYGLPKDCSRKMSKFRSSGVSLPIIMPLMPEKKKVINIAKRW
jgi:5,10-methylenetetrahydromethanopterin reductase